MACANLNDCFASVSPFGKRGKEAAHRPRIVMPEAAPAAIRHLRPDTDPKIPDKRLTALSGMTVIAVAGGVPSVRLLLFRPSRVDNGAEFGSPAGPGETSTSMGARWLSRRLRILAWNDWIGERAGCGWMRRLRTLGGVGGAPARVPENSLFSRE